MRRICNFCVGRVIEQKKSQEELMVRLKELKLVA